jgi:hypothetical protein
MIAGGWEGCGPSQPQSIYEGCTVQRGADGAGALQGSSVSPRKHQSSGDPIYEPGENA